MNEFVDKKYLFLNCNSYDTKLIPTYKNMIQFVSMNTDSMWEIIYHSAVNKRMGDRNIDDKRFSLSKGTVQAK